MQSKIITKRQKQNTTQRNPNRGFSRNQFPLYPTITPLQQLVSFFYQDFSSTRLTSTSSFSSYSIRANGLFDPDPLLLTGSISGFAEQGNLYRQYLVRRVFIDWFVSNNGVAPVILVAAPSLTNLAAVLSSGQAIANLAENRGAKKFILSGAGGQDRGRIRMRIPLAKYVSNNFQYNSGTYSGFMGSAPSNPATLIYLNFCAYSPVPLTAGVTTDLSIRFETKLYDIQTPLG